MDNLRALLIQRAARLQGRPALTAPGWGTLSWSAWRNRVEGVAFALLGEPSPPPALFSATGTPWDWACEVAAACCGLVWDPAAPAVDPSIHGGETFHPEAGRGPYHAREHIVGADTPFLPGWTQGQLLAGLRRLNGTLGWDHRTQLRIPLANLAGAEARATLWSLLYAGGHAVLEDPGGIPPKPVRDEPIPAWDPAPLKQFAEELARGAPRS